MMNFSVLNTLIIFSKAPDAIQLRLCASVSQFTSNVKARPSLLQLFDFGNRQWETNGFW